MDAFQSSDKMSTEPNSVQAASGITISSSEPITKEEREYLSTPKLQPIPPRSGKSREEAGHGAKPDSKVDVELIDESGRTHAKDGKYKGRPGQEAEPKAAKIESKDGAEAAKSQEPDEAEAAKEAKKQDAQTRIRDLAEKKNAEAARADRAERELAALKAKAVAEAPPAIGAGKGAKAPAEDKRPNIKDYDDWDKFQEATDGWTLKRAEDIARKAVNEDREQREQVERDERGSRALREAVEASDLAIKEAGGKAFLDKVAPTMERIMPSFEAERLGLAVRPLHFLGDYVIHSGKHATAVMEYIHESDPEIVDRFEAIGLLPESRQPFAVERELGMLHGAMKALHKLKASVITDKSEPEPAPFQRRAAAPPPSVQGSPHIAEPDLSKIDDFGAYMRLKGKRPKSLL
jgi:hypothetical protein